MHSILHTLSQVKKDIDTGKSRGFGFVRYFDEDIQKKVQGMKHTIKGRKVDVKFPKKVSRGACGGMHVASHLSSNLM